jgi:hypothetical protein
MIDALLPVATWQRRRTPISAREYCPSLQFFNHLGKRSTGVAVFGLLNKPEEKGPI